MAIAKDVFIICFVLFCEGNVISDLPDKKKNPEEMMEPRAFETSEKRIAEMLDMRVAEMVETRVAQDMSKLKDEIKKELAFDMTEKCKKINERNENDVKKSENFEKIVIGDLRQQLKDELMTELNQSISSAVPKAVRDLPYLVTCAYKVYLAQRT